MNNQPKRLTEKDILILTALVEAHKDCFGFLRGFGKATEKETKDEEYYNNLIHKLKNISYE